VTPNKNFGETPGAVLPHTAPRESEIVRPLSSQSPLGPRCTTLACEAGGTEAGIESKNDSIKLDNGWGVCSSLNNTRRRIMVIYGLLMPSANGCRASTYTPTHFPLPLQSLSLHTFSNRHSVKREPFPDLSPRARRKFPHKLLH
jgi:hypothetical protein